MHEEKVEVLKEETLKLTEIENEIVESEKKVQISLEEMLKDLDSKIAEVFEDSQKDLSKTLNEFLKKRELIEQKQINKAKKEAEKEKKEKTHIKIFNIFSPVDFAKKRENIIGQAGKDDIDLDNKKNAEELIEGFKERIEKIETALESEIKRAVDSRLCDFMQGIKDKQKHL